MHGCFLVRNDEASISPAANIMSLLRAKWANTHNGYLITTQVSMLFHVVVGMDMGEELDVEEESPNPTGN